MKLHSILLLVVAATVIVGVHQIANFEWTRDAAKEAVSEEISLYDDGFYGQEREWLLERIAKLEARLNVAAPPSPVVLPEETITDTAALDATRLRAEGVKLHEAVDGSVR